MEAACVWLIAGGVALVGAWFVIAQVFRPDPSRYSPGELAQVHAAWERNCDACHKPHSPGTTGVSDVLAVQERWRAFTCEKCHGDAIHAKISKETPDARQRCADCHHDHGGRAMSLTKISDAHCTRCHTDLPSHATETPMAAAKVDNFFTNHPDFKKLTEPHQRLLTFSHSFHI